MPKKKLFLAHFTFRSGEAEIPFHHTVSARNLEDAERRIEDYLDDFAAFPKRIGYLRYEYWHGYYAVDYEGVDPTTPDSVVRHLMMPNQLGPGKPNHRPTTSCSLNAALRLRSGQAATTPAASKASHFRPFSAAAGRPWRAKGFRGRIGARLVWRGLP